MLFGGRTDNTGRYCNEKCQHAGNLLAMSRHFSEAQIGRMVMQIHQGKCPKCGGAGPVDVHKAHQVWSAIILTSWSSSPALSCKSCATKRQLGAIAFSGLFGWWGFPWGLGVTPMQIGRNIIDMASGPQPNHPSAMLYKMARLQAGANLIQESQGVSKPPVLGGQTTPPPLPKPKPVPSPNDDERFKPKSDWQVPSRSV
jgi:hypothetical protein